MITRCPVCGTAFRVQRAQLAARGGKVRCGKCAAVFDGVAGLVEEGGERLALEPSPQLGLFDPSRRGAQPAPAEDAPLPEFMAELDAPRRSSWLWGFLALLAALALAAQAGYRFRSELAAYLPAAREPLEAACRLIGCAVQLPRRPDLMSIDSSELQADPRRQGIIVLSAVIRNRARFAQDYPALELTLTDDAERAVLRRVLAPRDYLEGSPAARLASQGIAGGGEAALRVYLDSSRSPATGYRLYLFYPLVKILVTGSIAYDTIMVFPDRFRNHLLADQLHILNVCFLTPEMRREYGGTAGNIGYNLRLLGEQPLVMAAVGEDIAPYLARFEKLGVGTGHLRRIAGQFTAQAFITTDLDDNQITAFHPGAMNYAHENHVGRELAAGIAIIAPDGKQGMLQHARECADAGVPFLFDPGQGLPMFSGAELAELVRLADYLAVNDYEGRMLEEKTGRRLEELARQVKALVVTHGAQGSVLFAGAQRHDIPCVQADAVSDPTGCGDAYRAGLLYGIAQGWDWPSTGKLGAVMGAIKIAHRGAQNHATASGEIEERFRRAFGYSPWKG